MASKKKIIPSKHGQPVNSQTGLNDQQELFCREYLMPSGARDKAFNGTAAAKAAGYSAHTAAAQASRLLRQAKIQDYLALLQQPSIEKFEVTQDRIMQEISMIAFSNIMDFVEIKGACAYIDLSKCSREQAAALAAFEVIEMPPIITLEDGEAVSRDVLKVKIKLWDKWPALEMLARRHDLVKPLAVDVHHSGKVATDSGDLARRIAFILRKQIEDQKAAAKPAPEALAKADASPV